MLLVGFLLTVINNRYRIDSHAMHDVVLGTPQSVCQFLRSYSYNTSTVRTPASYGVRDADHSFGP